MMHGQQNFKLIRN